MINDDDDDDDNHLIKENPHFSGIEDGMTSAMIFGINQEYIHTIFELRGTSITYLIHSFLRLVHYIANKTKGKSIRTLCRNHPFWNFSLRNSMLRTAAGVSSFMSLNTSSGVSMSYIRLFEKRYFIGIPSEAAAFMCIL
jgi:hypothetical protein